MAERLQRYLARAGVASRRHAETLITAGRVTVNNQPTTTLGTKVEPGDLVALDGKLVMPPENVSWYVLYKPTGVVTTLDDPQGRPTVRSFLDEVGTRVFPIGRLDWDAEGALLLTDDGAAAHRLLHPSFQVPRTYLAKVKGAPTDEGLARLTAGVRLEDGPARALEVERFQSAERNTWLRVLVGEGRPHLVKRLCAAIGHPVVRLFRPHQAGISVAGMQPGELRPLRPEELAVIAAVAAGQPVPPMTLSLPARRHGRADDDDDVEGDAGPRPPKPPRFGTRAWRNSPAGGAPGRHAGGGPSFPRAPAPERGARPSGGPGFQRGPQRERGGERAERPGRGFGARRPQGARPGGPAPERGARPSGGPGFQRGPQRERGDERAERPGRGFGARRPQSARPGGPGARGVRPGGRPGFERGAPGGREAERGEGPPRTGRAFGAKPRGGRPGGSGSERPRVGRPGGFGTERPRGGRSGGFAARRGAPGDRPSFGRGRDEGASGRSPRGGRGSGAERPQGARSGDFEARRGPPGGRPAFGRGAPRGRGQGPYGPPSRGGRAPGGTPRSAGGWQGGAGDHPRTPRPGARPSAGARGRAPPGQRGPPRPRGGGPRGPRR